MEEYSTFVGMDVHKNSIEIAIAEQGRKGEVRSYGKIDGTLSALDKVVRKLVSKGERLHFVYEAGPCGYEIYGWNGDAVRFLGWLRRHGSDKSG